MSDEALKASTVSAMATEKLNKAHEAGRLQEAEEQMLIYARRCREYAGEVFKANEIIAGLKAQVAELEEKLSAAEAAAATKRKR